MAFGDFTWICAQSSLPVCSILGPPTAFTTNHQPLLPTTCVARSVELANTIIFQAATDFAHIGALIMTTIMILHIRTKFTAVGRKEILTFFYTYLVLTCVSLLLDAGVLQATNTGPYLYFVAIQNGLTSALCTSLMINGFVGFQLYEDGTTLSVWFIRSCAMAMFVISFLVSLVTFKGWAGMGPENTTGLFVVLYVINALFVFVYVVMQILLVVNTLQDRWPLGDLFFGVVFFVVGQVFLYALGTSICESTSHYLDSVFFATVCNLLAVMMVYKYWDSITKEDLEFSVGTKQGNWEYSTKERLLSSADDSTEAFHPSITPEPQSKHGSFYKMSHPQHSSTYDISTTSLDFQQPIANHNYLGSNRSNSRLSGPGYAQMVEGRQSYGDVRKSANINVGGVPGQRRSESAQRMFEDYDGGYHTRGLSSAGGYAPQQISPPATRERSKPRAHGRGQSTDRY